MSRRRMKSRRARAAIASQREGLPPGVSLRGFRKPGGERKWSGSHDQARERRRRQIERDTLRPSDKAPGGGRRIWRMKRSKGRCDVLQLHTRFGWRRV